MAAFYWILLLLSVASVATRKSQRKKKSLMELAKAVECTTGKSALDYTMYGCYCGMGGRGAPKDEADWCCFKHDCCYGEAESQGCQTKTDPYHWTCKDHTAECDDLEDTCKRQICECDREAVECLRQAPYNPANCVWPDFLCTDKPPTCEDKSQQ
ncbi:phospholipase A2-like [Notolabrus celidotus]|uniref:phospholipase A2-like n=1 Tax=Notolabrus celidotus TaxID=1203425 RepID=UPI00148FF678|nr:phospholipase A2-like [Notolabrus celidotus]XP_034567014.1 phospholipase A2-like [Notolabrus celidotus]